MVDRFCAIAAYLDGLAVGSDTAEQYLTDLRAVFDQTRAAGLKAKLSKCLFGKKSIELLGHKVWRANCFRRWTCFYFDLFP
jgi:hypothetical protein